MKPLHTLTIIFILFLSGAVTLSAQTIHVVNNTPGSPGGSNVYTSVDDAITAAVDGDIIHIVPSQENYGSFTVDKQLQIFGIGINPDKQAPILSRVSQITIENNANGTTIEGLWLSGITINSDVATSNLTIRNNRFGSNIRQNVSSTINGLIIQNNLFEDSSSNSATINLHTGNSTSNVIITNNIFIRSSHYVTAGNQTLISHNMFIGTSSTDSAFGSLNNAQVFNNIFYGIRPNSTSTSATRVQYTSFQNNLVFEGGEFPIGEDNNTGSGNLENADPQFVDLATTNSTWNFTWDPTLQTGSPAIGAGTDGSDLGIFGGSASFDLTGVPRPLIQTLNLPAMIGTDQDLDVTIRARGN
ncbi:hypothetical protein [Rhodohalobacter sp. SW132]|uniref:hypothetical protein n=1 Tax=Rhodohalobacter sp. SW132 TaxID=2293433 RepID=UPI0011C05E8A|nr:hypothetical protein [Rhodohalobacter sp. SW132]